MAEDSAKIKRFLELFPDNLAEGIFHALDQNLIPGDNLDSMRGYLFYVGRYRLSFKDKKLESSHSSFYKTVKDLDSFILVNFFRIRPKDRVLVLHPDVKVSNPEGWKKFEEELNDLLETAESQHKTFRKLAEEYLLGEGDAPAITRGTSRGKSTGAKEPIVLKPLGITINEQAISMGREKEKITRADSDILYNLYFRFIEEPEQCVKIDILAKELKLAKGYIVNRISIINKAIRDLTLRDKTKSSLGPLIENELKRGYRMNHKYLIQFTKKK